MATRKRRAFAHFCALTLHVLADGLEKDALGYDPQIEEIIQKILSLQTIDTPSPLPPEIADAGTHALSAQLTALRDTLNHLLTSISQRSDVSQTNVLTSELSRSIVRNHAEVKRRKEEKMLDIMPNWLIDHPAVAIIPTSMPDLDVRDEPQVSLLHHCHKCLGEWIVTIPLADLDTYEITRWCRWCESTVWHKPESAQKQRSIRLRQQERKRKLED